MGVHNNNSRCSCRILDLVEMLKTYRSMHLLLKLETIWVMKFEEFGRKWAYTENSFHHEGSHAGCTLLGEAGPKTCCSPFQPNCPAIPQFPVTLQIPCYITACFKNRINLERLKITVVIFDQRQDFISFCFKESRDAQRNTYMGDVFICIWNRDEPYMGKSEPELLPLFTVWPGFLYSVFLLIDVRIHQWISWIWNSHASGKGERSVWANANFSSRPWVFLWENIA